MIYNHDDAPSMDQCLHIPEILRAVCDETTKKTALAVALTSSHFLQPGLDRIWREVDCFEAIIACLPTDLWEVQEAGGYLDPKFHVGAVLPAIDELQY